MQILDRLKDFTSLEQLAAEFGEAFYIASPQRLRQNCADFRAAFCRTYANTSLAYSYKTNYLPTYAATADKTGLYAEVVSGLELSLALELGIAGERIIFNGPAKTNAELDLALSLGVQINIDSTAEFEQIAKLRRVSNNQFNLGLRCNIELEEAPVSRFGLQAHGEELSNLVKIIGQWPNTRLRGLHVHILPPGKRAAGYRELAAKMIALSDSLFPHAPPQQLNLGGGFFSPMPESLKQHFGSEVADFSDYGSAIGDAFCERFGNQNGPELILEPGLALCADTMFFVCRVSALKKFGRKQIAMTSGSVYNIKPTKNRANLPLTVVTADRGPRLVTTCANNFNIDITGYTCMEDDLLYTGYKGELKVGDYLIFANVGAYTFVLSPPFIKSAPPIISLDDPNKPPRILRRRCRDDNFWHDFRLNA